MKALSRRNALQRSQAKARLVVARLPETSFFVKPVMLPKCVVCHVSVDVVTGRKISAKTGVHFVCERFREVYRK